MSRHVPEDRDLIGAEDDAAELVGVGWRLERTGHVQAFVDRLFMTPKMQCRP